MKVINNNKKVMVIFIVVNIFIINIHSFAVNLQLTMNPIDKSFAIYPNAKPEKSKHPGLWYEFSSKDSLTNISQWYENWYKDHMKDNGWEIHRFEKENDCIENIYKIKGKDNCYSGFRFRICDKKVERRLTYIRLILECFPEPDKNSIKAIEEAVRKAQKNSISKPTQK